LPKFIINDIISILIDIVEFMNFSCCKIKPKSKELKNIVNFLKIIAEENRLKILCMLQKQEMCVCEIWQFLNLSQNLTSHHLKILRDYRLVNARKEGLKVIYSINKPNLKKYHQHLSHFINK
jgi:ArsR family transcriptional regulator